jgi:hypothetical protein
MTFKIMALVTTFAAAGRGRRPSRPESLGGTSLERTYRRGRVRQRAGTRLGQVGKLPSSQRAVTRIAAGDAANLRVASTLKRQVQDGSTNAVHHHLTLRDALLPGDMRTQGLFRRTMFRRGAGRREPRQHERADCQVQRLCREIPRARRAPRRRPDLKEQGPPSHTSASPAPGSRPRCAGPSRAP